MAYDPVPWQVIDTFFRDNARFLVKHHLESYNDFFNVGLPQLFKEKNPIRFFKEQDTIVTHDTVADEAGGTRVVRNRRQEYKFQCNLYLGGREANRFYYGKPIIFDEDRGSHYMYPNEARLRNMTYAFTIHYDVDVVFKLFLEEEAGSGIFKEVEETVTLSKIYLGKFPIMLQSDMCLMKGVGPEIRYNMGECRNDPGGYFIVDGKEKVIICQEKFADNMLYIQKDENELYSFSAKIRSVSEDASKPIRTLAVRMVATTPSSSNGQVVVSIPNVRKPIPLFIVMRALGVISDKDIIQYCLLDMERDAQLIEYFRPSVHDAGMVFTQAAAVRFIGSFTKGKSVSHALDILSVYFLPHIGELNFRQKALYLGYIVRRMLGVASGESKPTNRDSYLYKRIEVSGMLIYQLFREYYTLQQRDIFLNMDKEYFYKKSATNYQDRNFVRLVTDNVATIFGNRVVESGFRRAFKGDWGAEAHTKRPGALQDLSRLSFWSTICQLRKTNIHIAADGAKIMGPRLLSGTQWGILCPLHTPDGGNIGLHKHLALTTHITSGCSGYPMIRYLRSFGIKILEECSIEYLAQTTKVVVNGAWVGATSEPVELLSALRLRRRNGLFSPFTSLRWNISRNEIIVLTGAGRPCHPLFYVDGRTISYQREIAAAKIAAGELSWKEAVMGFARKKVGGDLNDCHIYGLAEMYGARTDLVKNSAIIEYVDTSEMEGVKLAHYGESPADFAANSVTHIEMHPSVILGVMANQIIFPSNNQFPRDLFSCGQSKQAVSLYNSNYQNRMDKSAIVLNYGQTPLVKSRYLQHITREQHPYGVNAIVAVACYTGYNVEDAVIFNKASLDRGIFGTQYLNVYEAHEEETKVGNFTVNTMFMDVNQGNVIGLKPGYDYSHLDPESGLIREHTIVDDKTILMGMASNSLTSSEVLIDASIGCKKGQLGYVDKAFMTIDEAGRKLAKVRIRHLRIPAIGDKFCSRAGQKGTIGIVLEEADMPFTAEGMRPDLIVNPHAFPSRMTIGHLVETLIGKAGALYGNFGDCTAFINRGPKNRTFGALLTRAGFNSTGNEIMYNGMNGVQLETEIYFGPTFYLRLKHMVKDKLNYRARGPRTVLTRQTVQGRANNGGLRIGEMDRDAIVSHGMAGFLTESMMVRGDEFFMAICNKTGTIAIYNASRDLFLSPMADGPVKFVGNLEDELSIVPISRFGREFSIVRVPFAFKLLYQELQAMNVQMRIITADNVKQEHALAAMDDLVLLTDHSSFAEVNKEMDDALGSPPGPFTRPTRPTPFASPSDTFAPVSAAVNPFAPPGVQPPPPPTPETPQKTPDTPTFVPSPPASGEEDGPGYSPPSPDASAGTSSPPPSEGAHDAPKPAGAGEAKAAEPAKPAAIEGIPLETPAEAAEVLEEVTHTIKIDDETDKGLELIGDIASDDDKEEDEPKDIKKII